MSLSPAMHDGMQHTTIDLWQWRLTDPFSGRRYKSRHWMTEANALATDPAAERVPGSQELRQVDANPVAPSTSLTGGGAVGQVRVV